MFQRYEWDAREYNADWYDWATQKYHTFVDGSMDYFILNKIKSC